MGSKRFLSQFLSRDREKRSWPTKLLDDERLYRERILGGLFTVDRRKGTQLEEKDDDNNNKLVYSFHREKEQVTEARFSIPFGRGARFLRQFLTGGRREFSTRRIINSSPSPPPLESSRFAFSRFPAATRSAVLLRKTELFTRACTSSSMLHA